MILQILRIVFTLINTMIGSITLVLPLLFLQSGLITASVIVATIGTFNSYACYLFIQHRLPGQLDIPECLSRHFKNKFTFMPKLYSIISVLNLSLTCLIYFFLVNLQWQSLLNMHRRDYQQRYILYGLNAIFLVLSIFISDYFQIALRIACYGALSVITYFGIVIYLFLTNQQSRNQAPPLFSTNVVSIAGCMSLVFSIQTVYIPILNSSNNLDRKKQNLCLWMSFILGGCIYLALGVCGAYGIMGRTKNYTTQNSLLDFFNRKDAFPYTLEIAFLMHLYSVYPCYVSVIRKRLLTLLPVQDSQCFRNIISIVLIGSALGLLFQQFKMSHLMGLNGSISGFFYTYLIPGMLHMKCQYFPDKPQQSTKDDRNQIDITLQQFQNQIPYVRQQSQQQNKKQQQVRQRVIIEPQLTCQIPFRSDAVRRFQIFLFILMVILGFCLFVGSFIILFFKRYS